MHHLRHVPVILHPKTFGPHILSQTRIIRVVRQVGTHEAVVIVVDLIFLFRAPLQVIGHHGDHRDIFPDRRHHFGQAADPVGSVSLEGKDRGLGPTDLGPQSGPVGKTAVSPAQGGQVLPDVGEFQIGIAQGGIIADVRGDDGTRRDGPGQLP